MRTTITKAVSMMLVTVMVLGVVALPMRASAGLESLTPVGVWLQVFNASQDIAKEMLTPINNSPNTSAISRFSAFFESTLQDDLLYVTAEQMNELSYWLVQNGISVMPSVVPGRDLIALAIQDTSVFIPAIDTTIELDVDVGDMYTYSGKTVVRVSGGGAIDQDNDSFTGTSSTTTQVGVGDGGQLEDFDEETKDTGNTSSGPTAYFNKTDNTWYVKNENGIYVKVGNLVYNPVTQTYNVTTNEYNSTTNTYDNRSYTYQFYYDYTYITYIGSSAEYREAYKVYYELPDGRSSGDLTVDELKGISLQFDMVNYDKAASDNITQFLYPFDGDIYNSSFYESSLTWIRGASTSYLESPDPFGGCLYLDSSVLTRFNASCVPFNISDGFTFQVRLYSLGTYQDNISRTLWFCADSKEDVLVSSSYAVNSNIFLGINRNGLYLPINGGFYVDFPIGSWVDLTVCYFLGDSDSSSYWYYYLNGVLVGQTRSYYGPFYFQYPSGSSTIRPGTFVAPYIESLYGISVANEAVGGTPFYFDNMRLLNMALYTGVQSFTPTPVPFDTNLVYVLPSVADLNDNTVAIMSQLPVSGYRVGGIRPTDPTLATGYIYMHIDGDFVDSVQQWNGAYWEEVTARLFTGIRWIPVTAFNVFTLEDMFDIIDPDADGSGPGVDSIFQYYLWWSGEWGTFQEWLKGTMQTLIEAIQASGGGGSTDAPVVIVPGVNDQTTTSEITTENPDGSTTKTTIVSNASGLVYSNSVTTYPTDVNGNTKTITVYTDSSGVMYQTETVIDKYGNVTVIEPTKATGTLGSILKMITGGVMEIAGTVIEGFVTIVVDGVKFIIESADSLIDGVGSMISSLASSITEFAGTVQDNLVQPGVNPSVDGDDDQQGDCGGGSTYNMFDVFFEVLPPELVTALTLCFVAMIALPIINKMHF